MGLNRIQNLFLLTLILSILQLLSPEAANSAPASTEYKIKAAMSVKFTEYVRWPHSFEGRNDFIMCFAGTDNFGDSLDALKQQKIKGKTLKIRRGVVNKDIASCDLLYVGETSDVRVSQMIDIAKDKAVLTIGETDNFLKKGGMIELFIFQSKVNFKVNLPSAKTANISISSDLLSLAKEVIR